MNFVIEHLSKHFEKKISVLPLKAGRSTAFLDGTVQVRPHSLTV